MDLNSLVAEYMNKKGLASSLEIFEEECKRNGILLNLSPSSSQLSLKGAKYDDLKIAFQCGEYDAFFQLWSELVPTHLLLSDPTCQDLEFSLAVYFALYPIKYQVGDKQISMNKFKDYLNKKGPQLSQLQYFTVYCALPYIPDPTTHPSFKHLFTDSWTRVVQSKLDRFIEVSCSVSTAINNSLSLEELYYSFSSGEKEIAVLQHQLQELKSNYQTLAEVAIDLVEALEATTNGKAVVNHEYLYQMLGRLFDASSKQSISLMLPPGDIKRPGSSLQESVESLRQSISSPLVSGMKNYTPLDLPHLKHDLVILPNDSKVMLLKALRWRLTRSQPGVVRDMLIKEYIVGDLLGIKNESSDSLSGLIEYSDLTVKEHFCHLLNCLSSLKVGRDYLQSCTILSHRLCVLLSGLHEESPILRNVLGTVQKLSLRRPLQSSMISEGILEWVIDLLKDAEGLSDYTLRYALALLMNLCLRQEGKMVCVKISPKPLHILSELLEHENNEVRSYVNGILYSLVGVPEIRTAAIKMDMLESLQSAMRIGPPDLQSQLKYIATKLEEPYINDNSISDEIDEDCDEEGDPEAVDGEDENDESEITVDGEEILRQYFMEPSPLDSFNIPLTRPITPSSLSQLRMSTIVGTCRPATSHGNEPLSPIKGSLSRPKTSLS